MGKGLRTQARRALLQQVAPAYHRALGPQKQKILEQFVTATGYARKYALWVLNHVEEACAPPAALRRRYGPEVEEALVLTWKTLNRICTKRLIPFLPTILETLEEDGHLELDEEHRRQLLSISRLLILPKRARRASLWKAGKGRPTPLPARQEHSSPRTGAQLGGGRQDRGVNPRHWGASGHWYPRRDWHQHAAISHRCPSCLLDQERDREMMEKRLVRQ